MKTIKTIILGTCIVGAMWGCDSKEKARLQSKVDSLNVELTATKKVASTLDEVGVLIDSIDASRRMLRASVVEGTPYQDYTSRLKDINKHIKETDAKIAQLEKSVTNNNSMAISIKRLKADLEVRTQQIAALEQEVEKMRGENNTLVASINQKDSLINGKGEVIKMREQDIASLEGLVKDINTQSKIKEANLYYSQAQALETAAKRTKFAPHKKKETQREALELYKLSLSLGKEEAQERIAYLEKAIG